MKYLRFVLVILAVILLIHGCSMDIKEEEKVVDQKDKIYIQYQYSSEMKNDIIEIKNKILKFTYVDPQKLEDIPMVMEQRPYWTSEDLVTIEKRLTDKQVDKLIKLIQDSGFFDLKHIEGITDEIKRYYPYFISVKIGEKKHHVEYRSNPEGPSMPKAFRTVLDELYHLAEGQ